MRNPFRRAQKTVEPPPELKSGSFLVGMGAARTMAKDYRAFALEGYAQNPVVNACVDKIATAISSVDLLLYQKNTKTGKLSKVDGDHPLKTLINSPNPGMSGRQFIDSMIRYRLIGGNAYVFGVGLDKNPTKPPAELYLLNPSKVTVKADGVSAFPQAYEYKISDQQVTSYLVNAVTGKSAILHVKTFNPIDPFRGMAPMVAAAQDIDIFNSGSTWNLKLLQNDARPAGALIVKGSDGQPATLTDEQYLRLREQIETQYSGSKNAGRPMLLEGGLEFQQMSTSPKDMDFQNNMNMAARFIASVYGVPTSLVNIPGESTHANYEQARQALWTDTVLPLMSVIIDDFNRWLTPLYGPNLQLWYDEDMVPALEPLRKAKADRINESDYLSIDEKREAMGYDATPGGDVVLVPNTDIPLDMAGSLPNLAEPGSPADPTDKDPKDPVPPKKPD